jgi:hypothetical protein
VHLAYGGCSLAAGADDPADRAWLRDFLAPFFEERAEAPPAGHTRVTLVRERAAFEAARAAGAAPGAEPVPAFLADGAALSLLRWSGAPERWRDAGADAFLEREGADAWRVLAAPGAHFARVAWMRVLRELATLAAARAGAALLHASAVERAGRAVAFLGAKRSGKTSCLLSALRAPGVRFLANDRLCAEPGGVARGMPTILNLRADALEAFPALAQRVRAADPRVATRAGESRAGQPEWPRKPGAAGVVTAEFLALAGVGATAAAPLAALVFPRVSGRPGRFTLSRLAPEAALARLRDADLLRDAPRGGPFGAAPEGAGEACLENLAREVPCFACRLDFDAYAGEPSALLDEVSGARSDLR